MTLKEDNFDVEHDLEELERILEESDFEEEKRLSEEPPRCGQIVAIVWRSANLRPDGEKRSPMAWPSEAHVVATEQSQNLVLKPLPGHLE